MRSYHWRIRQPPVTVVAAVRKELRCHLPSGSSRRTTVSQVFSDPWGQFILGYVVVLVIPGPNMLAIGGLVALSGFVAAIPFGMGAVAGATLLAGLTQMSTVVVCALPWRPMAGFLAAVLLLLVAARIAFSVSAMGPTGRIPRAYLLEFA